MSSRSEKSLAAFGAAAALAFLAAVTAGLVSARAHERPVESGVCALPLEAVVATAKGRADILAEMPAPIHKLFVQRLRTRGEVSVIPDASYGLVFRRSARILFVRDGCVIGSAQSDPVAILTVIDLTLSGVIGP